MARIYGTRAPRRNRYRIYTILSLIIIVAIIVYIYIPEENQSDQNRTGLITNSNGTTVHSDTAADSEQQNDTAYTESSEVSDDSSLQGVSPNWETKPDSESEPVPQAQAITPQPETPVQPADLGEISAAMKPPVTQTSSEADKLIKEATALLNQGVSQIIPA